MELWQYLYALHSKLTSINSRLVLGLYFIDFLNINRRQASEQTVLTFPPCVLSCVQLECIGVTIVHHDKGKENLTLSFTL